MKLKFTLLAAAFVLFATHSFAQSKAPVDSVGYLNAQKAEIKKLGDGLFVIVPVAHPNERFVAANLNDSYKQDGMAVVVEGVIGKPKPNVRMAGSPFYIRSIRPAKDSVNPGNYKPADDRINMQGETGRGGSAGNAVTDLQGMVVYQADTYLIKAGQRVFAPAKLDDKYKMDGLNVKFSGNVLPIPPNVRMVGTPIELTAISVARKEVPEIIGRPSGAQPDDPPQGTSVKPEGERHPTDPLPDEHFDYKTKIKKEQGVIQKIGKAYVITASDKTRYVPANLPENFKEDGLKVIFGGYVGEIPANVRMAGLPLKLTAIKSDHAKAKLREKVSDPKKNR